MDAQRFHWQVVSVGTSLGSKFTEALNDAFTALESCTDSVVLSVRVSAGTVEELATLMDKWKTALCQRGALGWATGTCCALLYAPKKRWRQGECSAVSMQPEAALQGTPLHTATAGHCQNMPW